MRYQRKSDRGISLCNYDGNASVMYCLEEEDSSHGSEAKGTVHRAEGGSSSLLGVGLVLGLGTGGAGIYELATAEVGTLDELLVLERLIEVAGGSDVVGRLEVEGALDVIEFGSFNLGHVTTDVECTTNALKNRETINRHELRVVGNLEVVGDLGQERECEEIGRASCRERVSR